MAKIYFDTNPAIETNTFNIEFVSVLANVNFNENNFRVYPNPANKLIHVELSNTQESIKAVSIVDMLGKLVKNINYLSVNDSIINISDLEKGVYILEITTVNNLIQTKKLIIN